jgi:hypothetical protein
MSIGIKAWLDSQIAEVSKNYQTAEQAEIESGYHADLTMERKYEEGFLDALEFVKRELNK